MTTGRHAIACSECERLRADVERYKASAGMWRNKCYELGGTPLPWEPEELMQKAVAAEREACANVAEPQDQHDDPLTAWKIAAAIRARGKQ